MATSSSTPGGLRIHSLDLNREGWENVPERLVKCFNLLQQNNTSIKRWSERQEERLKQLGDLHSQVESHLEATNASLKGTRNDIETISNQVGTISNDLRQHAKVFLGSIHQLFNTTHTLWGRFGRCFGDENQITRHVAERPTTLEELSKISDGLESSVSELMRIFDVWDAWRESVEDRTSQMQAAIGCITNAASQTRQRLLQWREMLRENEHAVDALSVTLRRTEADMQILHQTQVRQEDLETAVDRRGQQLEQLLSQTEKRFSSVTDHVELDVANVRRTLVNFQQSTEERIEEHSNRVAVLIERSLNPINAYLNSIHVKGDIVRSDVDRLQREAPSLASRLEEVKADMGRIDGRGQEQVADLANRIDSLRKVTEDLRSVEQKHLTEVKTEIQSVREEYKAQAGDLSASMVSTAEALERLRVNEISAVTKDVYTLEQKVAKWIHAHPLPAKISEARLYAIESRLTQEMDARLHLEEDLRSSAQSRRAGLPSLQDQQRRFCSSVAAPTSARGSSSVRCATVSGSSRGGAGSQRSGREDSMFLESSPCGKPSTAP
eukprot:TRINITY_DN13515_c0_g1_i1.p1 TRINITY_DN13515_c0_g1~~TRINITY_DN13515_c0_g1_i1.p1  ORF type:complete len:553 (+),score=90.44 TRINITY_DN13515_c0_g1_i1:110-1768(+)